MPKNMQAVVKGTEKDVQLTAPRPRSLAVAVGGVKTGRDFTKLMSCLMSDVLEGRITNASCNATCNAGGKMLKAIEMQHKYGTRGAGQAEKVLSLSD